MDGNVVMVLGGSIIKNRFIIIKMNENDDDD